MDSLQTKEVRLEQLMPLIKERLSEGKTVRFFPNGISMLPMLRQGLDSVQLSPLPNKLKKYDLPLYQRDNGQYVLHRIVKVGETYTCIGDNQFSFERELRHDQMIALVTSFNRDNKEISAQSISYQIYCRLWHFSRPIRRIFRAVFSRIRRLFP
jgi:hypothetical protein